MALRARSCRTVPTLPAGGARPPPRPAETSRSITGFSCPAKKNRAARSSSPLVPMYEPRIDSCLENSALRLSAPLAPVVAPQVTSRPPRASARTLLAQVASPTCSMTTSTPRLFVSRLISAAMSCRWWLITSDAPSARARSSLSSDAGGREHARAVQERRSESPPGRRRCRRRAPARPRRAAACARVISMCHAVRNVSGNAAACTKSISSGIGIRFCTGTLTYSA